MPRERDWKRIACAVAFALLPAGFASTAHADEFHVAITGDNGNPGTDALPWRTISYAVATMEAGDTTYVHSGTYEDEGQIHFGRSGTEDAPIELLNAPGEAPIIDCGDFAAGEYPRIIVANDSGPEDPVGWIRIEGFEIRGCYNGIKFHNMHDAVIRKNWIHDIANSGILGNGARVLIERNVVSDSGGPGNQDHGLYITGSAFTIRNNLIYDNAAHGIQQNGSGSSIFDPDVHAGPEFAEAKDWIVANNTFAYSNSRAGIVVWGARCDNARIENNIFHENGQLIPSSAEQGVYLYSGVSTGVEVRNNFAYATEPGATGFLGVGDGIEGTNYTQSDNIINRSDPGFVDGPAALPPSPNFALTEASGAIGIGLVNELPYNGEAPDAGAFETFGVASAQISGDTMRVMLEMNLNTPVIVPADAAGWTVSCSGPACGTPAVAGASRANDSDSTVELRISGIVDDNCAEGQTWSVSYDASVGAVTDSSLIGAPSQPHNQPLFSFADQAVANDCSEPPTTGTASDGSETATTGARTDGDDTATGAPEPTGSGPGETSGASTGSADPSTPAGCGCAATPDRDGAWLASWMTFAALRLRRRRRAPRDLAALA